MIAGAQTDRASRRLDFFYIPPFQLERARAEGRACFACAPVLRLVKPPAYESKVSRGARIPPYPKIQLRSFPQGCALSTSSISWYVVSAGLTRGASRGLSPRSAARPFNVGLALRGVRMRPLLPQLPKRWLFAWPRWRARSPCPAWFRPHLRRR